MPTVHLGDQHLTDPLDAIVGDLFESDNGDPWMIIRLDASKFTMVNLRTGCTGRVTGSPASQVTSWPTGRKFGIGESVKLVQTGG